MKTQICIPCLDMIPALTVGSILGLDKPDCEVVMEVGSVIHSARNSLAARAIKTNAQWTWWVDSDMTFNPDTLTRMMKTAEDNNLSIISAVCYRRKSPFTPVLFDHLDIKSDTSAEFTEMKDVPEELFEVQGVGFGCILVRTQVLVDVLRRFGTMFSPIGDNSEDLSFCWRARQCGYKIYADPTIYMGHIGQSVYTAKTYESVRKVNS